MEKGWGIAEEKKESEETEDEINQVEEEQKYLIKATKSILSDFTNFDE